MNLNVENTENNAHRSYQTQVRQLSFKIRKFIATLILALFIGSLCLTNFSMAFFIALSYVPLALAITQVVKRTVSKAIQTLFVFAMCPFVHLIVIYLVYTSVYDKGFGSSKLVESISDNFYSLYMLSKISNIWTFDVLCLGLFPIWLLFWFMATARYSQIN